MPNRKLAAPQAAMLLLAALYSRDRTTAGTAHGTDAGFAWAGQR